MTFIEVQNQVFNLVARKDSSFADHISFARKIDNEKPDFPEYFRKIKVAFLSNFTLLGLPDVFKTRAIFHNINTETYLGAYNQYAQEILNSGSDFYKFRPAIAYLIMDSEDSDEAQVNQLVNILQKREIVVRLLWSKDLKNKFANHWNTKYRELGDFRMAPDAFPVFADELLGCAVAVSGATKKCLVLDLDNTLWRGVVGEDGLEGIEPYQDLQRHILSLYNTGTILAINSKNNLEDALEAIESHPKMILRKNHFAAWRINWQDKASNMRELADELMLGADSFVFVDDSPFEQNIIATSLPEVAVLHPSDLKTYTGFQKLKITEEDKRRGKTYAEERTRRELRSSLGNVEDFIKSLNLEVTIREVKADSPIIPRLAQMTQKTNQFNMTTKRWSEGDIRAFLGKRWNYRMWAVEAVDRFGDYGTIGFLAVKPAAGNIWEIDNFLMSCRILGRGIERALLAHVIKEARNMNLQQLVGVFIPTKKNQALCESFYPENGFSMSGHQITGPGSVLYERGFNYAVVNPYPFPSNIKVNFA